MARIDSIFLRRVSLSFGPHPARPSWGERDKLEIDSVGEVSKSPADTTIFGAKSSGKHYLKEKHAARHLHYDFRDSNAQFVEVLAVPNFQPNLPLGTLGRPFSTKNY